MSAADKKPATKAKKPTKVAEHPKYSEMVAASLAALKERKGSSKQAILKYINANYKVGDNQTIVNNHVKAAIKRGVLAGVLLQPKGTGASGSFKLPKVEKSKPKPKKVAKAKKPASKKPAAKKPVAAKKSTPKKKKKTAAKKTPSKAKPAAAKKSASAKKPAAKKPAKKAAAKKPAAKKAKKTAPKKK